MFDFVYWLHKSLKINVLHYEYTGYGPTRAVDTPSESKAFECIETAYEYLKNEEGVDDKDMIVYGTSVGA